MTGETRFEVRFADGQVELADSLWGAHHIIARHAAFAADPLHPRNVLPAQITLLDPARFGGRVFVERVDTVSELSTDG